MMRATLREGDHVGPYRVVRWLGRGAYSEVYEAQHRDTSSDHVALKVFSNVSREAGVLRESAILFGVRHPNLISAQCMGYGAGARSWLALDLARGGSLRARLADGALSARECRQVMIQTCRAVHFLHKRGIVHGDIKPDNVLFDGDASPFGGLVRVADFGATVGPAQSGEGPRGTPAYMAPEVLLGDVSVRSDIYALGVMAMELLTGENDIPTYEALAERVGETTAHALSIATAARPEDRPASAMALAYLLDAALAAEREGLPRAFPEKYARSIVVDSATAHYMVLGAEDVRIRSSAGLEATVSIAGATAGALSLASAHKYLLLSEQGIHTASGTRLFEPRAGAEPGDVGILYFSGLGVYAAGTAGYLVRSNRIDASFAFASDIASVDSVFTARGDVVVALMANGQSAAVLPPSGPATVVHITEGIANVCLTRHSCKAIDRTGRVIDLTALA